MEKFKEALKMILAMILNIIDYTFAILESPYIVIISICMVSGLRSDVNVA